MRRIRARFTYANVVATLALFVALAGGTAFAASRIMPKNSDARDKASRVIAWYTQQGFTTTLSEDGRNQEEKPRQW